MVNKILKSFQNAANGIKVTLKETNYRLHWLAFIVAFIVAIVLGFSATDMAILISVSGVVLVAETINTALEELTDELRENKILNYKQVGATKDIAAGAVLTAAVMAVVIGIVLVLKYI